MKQKLALSCALIHKPTILFLDEPTTGVDPVSRKEFWGMLKRLKEQGITILVSTPYMDEATLCDRIALMNNGEMLKIDTPENIIKQFGKKLWAVQSDNMYKLLHDLRENESIESCFAFGDTHHITLHAVPSEQWEVELKAYLAEKGHKQIEIREIKPGIEDCFMEITPKSPEGDFKKK